MSTRMFTPKLCDCRRRSWVGIDRLYVDPLLYRRIGTSSRAMSRTTASRMRAPTAVVLLRSAVTL